MSSHEQDGSKPAWMMSFEEFIGPVIIGPYFDFTIESEDYDHLWDLQEDGLDDLRVVDRIGDFLVRELQWDSGANYLLTRSEIPSERIVGCYLGGMLWIAPDFRGRGLGSELVAIAAEDLGTTPVSNDGGMGFTEGGYNAHQRAHLKIIRRATLRGEPVPDDLRALAEAPDNDEIVAPSP